MTLGRTLWAVIFIKLFIIFVVLKLFFFPNYIKEHAEEGQEAEFVFRELNIEAAPRACYRSAILKRAWTLLSLNRSLEH
jgi:hypothetical protein